MRRRLPGPKAAAGDGVWIDAANHGRDGEVLFERDNPH
jgi:hypothetical protein